MRAILAASSFPLYQRNLIRERRFKKFGSFAMIAQDGRVVTNADLAGRPYLVFFGYTHCPDVCPTALFDISAVFKELGPGKRFSLPSLSH
jgi:cytochrome oxidase Cu insertion factor (SCO1/SenC/PrrC family)